MSWWDTAPVLLSAAAFLLVPGLLAAAAVGARGILLWGVAGPVSVSIIALSAVVLGLLGIPLSPGAVAVASLVVAAVCLLGRVAARRRFFPRSPLYPRPRPGWSSLIRLAAVAVPALLLAVRFVRIFGHPENISQTFDNVYHLNLVHYILDTGNGSALTAGRLVDPSAALGFYPAAWHDLVALAAGLSGAAAPVAIHAVNIVVAALIWPLAAILLAVVVAGNRPAAWVLGGLAAAGFSSFPYLMVSFGVLYPNFLSLALLPALLALCAVLAGRSRYDATPGMGLLLLAACVPGLGMAHPSSFLALIVLTLPLLFSVLWTRGVRLARAGRAASPGFWLPLLGCAAYLGLVGYFWGILAPDPSAGSWEPYMLPAQAFGEGLVNAPLGTTVPVVIAVLTFIGAGTILLRRQQGWVLGVFTVGLALYTIAAGWEWSDFRTYITGNWYNDSYRLAAILPIATLGVVVTGGLAAVDQVSGGLARLFRSSPDSSAGRMWFGQAPGLVPVVLAAALGVSMQGAAVRDAVAGAEPNYRYTEDANLLSTDEAELLNRLGEHVPEDATVIGSPWTGTALVYAIADRTALTPHIFYNDTPQVAAIMDGLDEAEPGSAACAAVRELDAEWVLDFGTEEVNRGHHPYEGLDELADSPAVELVDEVGDAKLYRVTACG